MSDKQYEKIQKSLADNVRSKYKPRELQRTRADNLIRELKPVDMSVGVKLVIQLVNGFERFGSHDTWDDGYRISDDETVAEHKDLLEAIKLFKKKKDSKKE